MKLETKIKNILIESGETNQVRFDVIAHELWGNNRDGFDLNSSCYIATNTDIEGVLESARGRWEVFKCNYLSNARVKDIEDIGFDRTISLEVNQVPFLEIRHAN